MAAFELAKHSSLDCTLVTMDAAGNEPHIKLEVLPENAQPGQQTELSASIQGEISAVDGYLGHFDLILKTPHELTSFREVVGANRGRLDIVLDMSGAGLISSEIKPPGYFAVTDNDAELEEALQETGLQPQALFEEWPEEASESESQDKVETMTQTFAYTVAAILRPVLVV